MAKKESTNDKIIRLFKSGIDIENIATDTGMLPDQVKHVIENRIPNYQNYDYKMDQVKHEVKRGGFFKKKTKLDFTMGKDGFISDQTRTIAELLAKGESYEKIETVFDISQADIKQVDEYKETHFRRYFTSFPDKKDAILNNQTKSEIKPTLVEESKKPDEEESAEIQLIPNNRPKTLTPVVNTEPTKPINVTIESEPKNINKESKSEIMVTNTESNKPSNAAAKVRMFAESQIKEDEAKLEELELSISNDKIKLDELLTTLNNNKTKKDVLLEQLESIKEQIADIDTTIAQNQADYNNCSTNIDELVNAKNALLTEIADYKTYTA